MKTLRAKLFISIGAIFLAVGIFNNIISEIWIRKELSRGGSSISTYINQIENQIHQFSSFLLTFRIVEAATDLDKAVKITTAESSTTETLWEEAKNIISYDSEVAFVQIQDSSGKTVIISPKDAVLHPFCWSSLGNTSLWVTVPNKKGRFIAIPTDSTNKTFYLLFKEDDLKTGLEKDLSLLAPSLAKQIRETAHLAKKSNSSNLEEIQPKAFSYTPLTSPSGLFNTLLAKKEEWLKKTNLIRDLVSWQENKSDVLPVGILELDAEHQSGCCLFSDEAFSTKAIVKGPSSEMNQKIPSLLLRRTEYSQDLDMIKTTSFIGQDGKWIALGSSLSSLLQEVSSLFQRTIIATGADISIGIASDGKIFDTKKTNFPLESFNNEKKTISWEGASYTFAKIDLDIIKIFVLTPLEQSLSISTFLNTLSEKIVLKISTSLILAAVISFIIAIILLHNIARKITKPIAALSKASEELGKGKYEGLILPETGSRQDEIYTLTDSFKNMVGALKDRDKIRGVLNKVVSKEISTQILEHNIELDGEEKIVTLLFSDIRNFTRLAEGLPPHTLIEVLNTYMTRMCRIIDETRGVVDKFVGDAIMTLYGAPITYDFHATNAIACAILMIKDLSLWNEERKKNNQFIFEIGIGIHTGLVYTGNMGAENRLNYTAIGANVNQASRLCSVAKPMQILISEDTFNAPGVSEKFHVKKLQPVLLKGIENPVQVYEVIGYKNDLSS